MAKTSVVARSQKKPKFKSRTVRRCFRCGRKHGYMRDFDMCRICFRELANEGEIPGIKKIIMVNDKIANFINGLKIANKAGKNFITTPSTKLIKAIADVLVKEGFISSVEAKEKDKKPELKVELKYSEGTPVITDTKRMSHLSKRLYRSVNEIKSVKNGFGIAVLTTPLGVMSNKGARRKNVGGEILFEIW